MSIALPKAAVLDLDGTLLDTVPDIAAAADQTMAAMNLPRRGAANVSRWVGNGIDNLIRRALANDMSGEVDEDLFAQAKPIFMRAYQAVNGKNTKIYPGVEEGLDLLAELDIPLACLTNKAEAFTLPLLAATGLAGRFEMVISGDTLTKRKPDPLPLLHIARGFDLAAAEMLLIGDSVTDVKTARAAGCAVACVNYGYNHGHDIALAGPDAVLDSLAELGELLTEKTSVQE